MRQSESPAYYRRSRRVILVALLRFVLLLSWFGSEAIGRDSTNQSTVILAVGAAGEESFGREFARSAELWTNACLKAHANLVVIGLAPTNKATDLALLKQAIENQPGSARTELWIVLIGHGTFDGNEAKFNLRGPDLSASELAAWLKPFHRPLVVIDCSSASAPFLAKLSGPGRTIVTATRSGYEQNYARFGQFLAQAIDDPLADLDKDGQTSLLEAFVLASRRVAEFYDADGRLATEHALIDDNGDGLGTPAGFFRGVRAVKKPEGGASPDGLRARQICLLPSRQELKLPPESRARRDDLESAVEKLRQAKATLPEDEYYRRMENLMVELAKLYSQTPP